MRGGRVTGQHIRLSPRLRLQPGGGLGDAVSFLFVPYLVVVVRERS
jgi:hypothetical protein